MSYAVKADLTPRRVTAHELAELTDDGLGQVVNDAIVTDTLTEASGKVDSYCRMRYAVPLQASEQVKGLTLDIAMFLLFTRRRRVTDEIQKLYDAAISFLKDVAAGKAALDQPVGATPQKAGGEVQTTATPEKFGDDNIFGFVQ